MGYRKTALLQFLVLVWACAKCETFTNTIKLKHLVSNWKCTVCVLTFPTVQKDRSGRAKTNFFLRQS